MSISIPKSALQDLLVCLDSDLKELKVIQRNHDTEECKIHPNSLQQIRALAKAFGLRAEIAYYDTAKDDLLKAISALDEQEQQDSPKVTRRLGGTL